MAETYSNEFELRFNARYDELKWLYCELYNNDEKGFDSALAYYHMRPAI